MYLSSKFIRLYYTNRIFVKITRTLKKCIYTESLKELVFKGVQFNGSIVEIEQKKQAVETLFAKLESGLILEEIEK